MIYSHVGDGVTTRFGVPPHSGTVTATVNGTPATISSQGFDFVVLSVAPAAGATVDIFVATAIEGNPLRILSEVNTQASGAVAYTLPGSQKVSVYVAPEGGATGTVALTYRPNGATSSINLVDANNAQVTFNLASPGQPYIFDGDVSTITFTPTSVTVGYRAVITAWL